MVLDRSEGVLILQKVSEGCVLVLLFKVFVCMVCVTTVPHLDDVECILEVDISSELLAGGVGFSSGGGFFQAFNDEEVRPHAPQGGRGDRREEPLGDTLGLDLRGEIRQGACIHNRIVPLHRAFM